MEQNDGVRRSGMSRTTTIGQDQMIVDITLEEMDATSKIIKEEFKTLGIDISESAVQRRLKDAGLKYMRPLLKPLLREWHREQALVRAKSMQNYNWSQVIATDETYIHLFRLL